MAYSVDDIAEAITYLTSSRTADDGALDFDATTCLTNGTTGEDCDEIKNTLSSKIAIDVQGGALLVNTKVRVFVNSVMTGGDTYLLPYTDANSVSGTNEIGPETIVAGEWDEFTLSSAFIADLAVADVNGYQYVRYASDGTAKPKIGEVQADALIDLDVLSGISRDNAGAVEVSCNVFLLRKISGTELVYVSSVVSHGTTGAFSFNVGPGLDYVLLGQKDGTPNIFDITDYVQGV